MKNTIPISIILAGVLIAGALVYMTLNVLGQEEGFLSQKDAEEKIMKFINEEMLVENTATLDKISEESGIYKIEIDIEGSKYTSYITKDVKFLFTSVVEVPDEIIKEAEVSKSEKPDVKIFVMSYCPYGLQAQKMFLPVYNLLKDKADFGIYFVDYIMHGKDEIDENLNQYCIQKEENEKYYSYLSCFVISGDSESCLTTAGIDREKLNLCVSETDAAFTITDLYNDQSTWLSGNYPLFNIHADLNNEYGIQGSPTVVINDNIVSVNPRSPENFKNIICQAFENQPAECLEVLSEEVPIYGFGAGTGSNDGGSCE